MYAAVAAGVGSLSGELHGGANVKVIDMLEQVHAGGMTADQCIAAAKDKDDPFLLFDHFAFNDPLRMWIEVVSTLQMCRDQQNKFRICMIR